MRGPQPWETERARALRSKPVSAEAELWRRLRARKLGGFKFVRQAPVDVYFADFLCRDRKLIVEVDGGTHNSDAEMESDNTRTDVLEALGYRVFRVTNDDVYRNIEPVLDAILAEIEN